MREMFNNNNDGTKDNNGIDNDIIKGEKLDEVLNRLVDEDTDNTDDKHIDDGELYEAFSKQYGFDTTIKKPTFVEKLKRKIRLRVATMSLLDVLLYCILFMAIGVLGASTYWGNYITNTKPYLLNDKVADMLSDYYGDKEIDSKELEDIYVKSVAQALGDKYTFYSFGEQAESLDEQVSGKFCGIGVRVLADEKGIKISEVMENSPAEKVGLQSGDIIFKVDGEYINTETYGSYLDSIDKIKGDEGTQVEIEIYRDKTAETKVFTVTREQVETQEVSYKSMDGFGYIKINSFSDNTAEQFSKCLSKSEKNGDSGLIIDLRGNLGGLLDSVTSVANELMDNKILITQKYKNDKDKIIKLENGKSYNKPIVVLVNGATASASEVLAGSLRDNCGSRIIGETTYGKGVICTYKKYSDGSASCVSSGEYILPNGESINEIGIKPDVEVENDNGDGDKQLECALDTIKKYN